MPKKIVYFTKYSRNGASSRLRSFQYIDKLVAENNVEITVQSLFSEEYLEKRYKNQSILKETFIGYFSRFFFLFKIFKYDKIVIEKELFPYVPALFEWILFQLNVKYIVDYDDAIFHNYDQDPRFIVRKIFGKKIASVIKYANIVVVGNSYLENYAIQSQAKKIVIIPTVIDIERYLPKNDYFNNNIFTIGWIGTPKTIRYFKGNLEYIISDYKNNFKIITIGGKLEASNFLYEFIEWNENTEVDSIKKLDVGIMPLHDFDFDKGKCAYKLIQFMACGIPVIASPVGVNSEIIQEGFNGFLVHEANDWKKHINYFIQNPDQIKILGEQARQTILKKYTLQVQYPILKKLLEI